MVRVQLVTRVRTQYVTMASAQPMTRIKAQCLAGISTQNVHRIKKQSGNMTGIKTQYVLLVRGDGGICNIMTYVVYGGVVYGYLGAVDNRGTGTGGSWHCGVEATL